MDDLHIQFVYFGRAENSVTNSFLALHFFSQYLENDP